MGSEDFCLGFRLAGIKNAVTAGKDEVFEKKVKELKDGSDYGIVVMDGERFEKLSYGLKKKVKSSVDPIFVSLSEKGGGETLRSKIKESVGVDLLR